MAVKLGRSGRRSGAPPATLKVGDVIAGKYRVERMLGEGGMGLVVAAHHELLDQHVAVKLLYEDDKEAVARLLIEARSAAKLGGEHVARVLDIDVGENGLPFIVMELLEGQDLGALIAARGRLPRWIVADYMLQALEGIAEAHARGIVHRDIKPSNLFLTQRPGASEFVKILDFGVSKSLGESADDQHLTGVRSVLGSPPYMSPEQVRNPKSVDHRTDIWSLGVVMYELLTNTLPFHGEAVQETFAQILEKPVPSIRALVTGVPAGLDEIVAKCLERDREARFADVGELARALTPFGSGSWVESANRIAATLARPPEDLASNRTVSGSEIPRALRSDQHELSPTASTLQGGKHLIPLTGSQRMIVAAAGGVIVAGMIIVASVLIVRRGAPVEEEPPVAAAAQSVVDPALASAAPPPSLAVAPIDPAPPPGDPLLVEKSPTPTGATDPSSSASAAVAGRPPKKGSPRSKLPSVLHGGRI